MRKISIVLGLLSLTTLVGAAASCTSSSTPGAAEDAGGGGAIADGSTKKEASTSTEVIDSGVKGGTGKDSGNVELTPDEVCAQKADNQACGECCITGHQKGYATIEKALLACACMGTGATGGGAGPCATACAATACSTPPAQADNACDTCLGGSVKEQNSVCTSAVVSACQADDDCLAQQACIGNCQ